MTLPKAKPPLRKYRDVAPEGDVPTTRTTGIDPDFWYPLARSRDLKPGKTLAVKFAGTELVLVRPQKGAPYALEDRCAHRQVPLSMGVVKDEQLQCGYHCWAYDRTGACVSIPYLDRKRTLPNGVRAYACREEHGFVFVFPGNQELAEVTPVPELPYHGDRRYKTRVLDRDIACHYSFMHENLMDMNHQFLHRSLMGRIRAKLLDVREGEDWLEADYSFSRTSGKQSLGERLIIGSGNDDKYADLMTIRTGYPYQTLRYWTDGKREEPPALDLWNAYVPTDRAQHHNHTFGLIMVQKPPIPGVIHLLWPVITLFTEGIFGQDRVIVEAEQRAYETQGADLNNEVFPIIQSLKALLARRGVPIAPEDLRADSE
ncbi:aromatic ring-hydroxylating dioxygenase subunit alpha [Streptomyces sp. NBC_00669]|uniref:aromatic ring-hydroxylating dioxygenase subunit alpha n=1 Tax=unclassified Streptomyces TaxID=2593676 RepID=UPI002E2FC0E4|nr:aromatic ring-hydroxylating dioxygenase subunit alpha [Streptomyces sp. NBC_00669]